MFSVFVVTGCKSKQTVIFPFQEAIDQFITEDKKIINKDGVILFVGSSSFTYWKGVKQDLGCDKIINRGFGGSTLTDLINHKKTLFSTFNPKQIFIYCGENDVASSEKISALDVLSRWKTLHNYIRRKNSKSQIYFISLKPSPSRWHLSNTMKEVNNLIKEYNRSVENTYFIDLWPHMLSQDNRPKAEIFLKDSLHMNNNGYDIWVDHLLPKIECN